MLNKVKQIWSKNPILVLVFVAFTLAILMLVWSWLKKGFAYIFDSVKGVGSTLSKDEAEALASAIYSEINSMFTDEDNIVDLVVPLTLADYHKVKAAFGIQPYNATLDEFSELGGDDSNLTEVLNKTLSESDKEKIKSQNPLLPIT
ncbi:hypothetical protein [Flagellimonas sp. 2504JD4-2]